MPDGVLFGSSKAHRDLRRMLVEDQKLDAVVKRAICAMITHNLLRAADTLRPGTADGRQRRDPAPPDRPCPGQARPAATAPHAAAASALALG